MYCRELETWDDKETPKAQVGTGDLGTINSSQVKCKPGTWQKLDLAVKKKKKNNKRVHRTNF